MKAEHAARFWAFVDKSGACWLWTGYLNRAGYGVWNLPRELGHAPTLAHRLAYTLNGGSIPDGLQIDHLCNTPRCVNPAHLEPVTQQENQGRGKQRRTACRRGHTWTDATTYVYPKTGHRYCRECWRVNREARAERVAA